MLYVGYYRVTDADRTRDIESHNLMLYQLSYGHQKKVREGVPLRYGARRARNDEKRSANLPQAYHPGIVPLRDILIVGRG